MKKEEITHYTNRPIKKFLELPIMDGEYDEGLSFTSIVILPTRKIDKDSGYRLMNFVCIKDHKPIYRMSGCADVIFMHPSPIWKIDCLPVSGLLNIHCRLGIMVEDIAGCLELFSG